MRTIRAFLACSALLVSGPLSAQVFFEGYAERWETPFDRSERLSDTRPLAREDIGEMLNDEGLHVLSLRPDRGDWMAEVRDPAGRRLRLIIDGYDGRILGRAASVPLPVTRSAPHLLAPAPAAAPAPTLMPSEPAPPPQTQSAPPPTPTKPPRIIPLYNKP